MVYAKGCHPPYCRPDLVSSEVDKACRLLGLDRIAVFILHRETLSIRIKKAEQAEADARDRAGVRDNEQRTAQRAPENPELNALAGREGAVAGDVGLVEILRGALLATKASGQPDWPTRVSAAQTLAALRPEEVEPKPEHDQGSRPGRGSRSQPRIAGRPF